MDWETIKFFVGITSAVFAGVASLSVAYLHLFIQHSVSKVRDALVETLERYYVRSELHEGLVNRVERLEKLGDRA